MSRPPKPQQRTYHYLIFCDWLKKLSPSSTDVLPYQEITADHLGGEEKVSIQMGTKWYLIGRYRVN